MPDAYDRSQIMSVMNWSNSFRPNTAFPLDARQYFGSLAEAEAAAATAGPVGSTDTIYHFGMQLFVFDGTDAKAYLIQGDKTLKEIGSGAAVEPGEELKWEGDGTKVNFHALTRDQFNALAVKDAGTLYFISDEHAIYRGTENYSDEIDLVTAVPDVADAVPRKVYIDITSMEIKATIDNVNWIVASPGYLTDNVNWAEADSNKLATIGLIKKALAEAVGADYTLGFDPDTGAVSLKDGSEVASAAVLAGVAHNPSYNSETLTITIPVFGQDDLTIEIPAGKFITGGRYNEETGNIELIVDGQDEPILIPAGDIVKQLEAANEGKDVQLTIADGKISASVVIDPAADNLLTSSEAGLKVAGESKMDKLEGTAADAGKILIVGPDGTSAVIGEYTISEALAAALKVEGAVKGNLTAFGDDGALTDSGVAVGGATLSEAPNEKTVATEAAVDARVRKALSWEAI